MNEFFEKIGVAFNSVFDSLDNIVSRLEALNRRFNQSSTLNFFTGSGVFKFAIIPPRYNDSNYVEKEGGFYIEAAGVTGKKVGGLPEYDWKTKKITFSLNVPEITQMLDLPEAGVKFYHKDQSGENKFDKMLVITPPNPQFDKYKISLSDKVSGVSISIPMTHGQMIVLMDVAKRSVPVLVGLPI